MVSERDRLADVVLDDSYAVGEFDRDNLAFNLQVTLQQVELG